MDIRAEVSVAGEPPHANSSSAWLLTGGRLDLLLTPDVTVLAPLVTDARPTPFVSGKLEEFERRRARQGHGGGQDDRIVCLPNIFCPLAVYVDGALLWSPGMTELPPDIMPIMARELEAVEVYRGPSETPVEYQGTGSGGGVMMLWTRVSGSSWR